MTNSICSTSCNHCEAFLCYFAVYCPSISYVQCKTISAKLNQLFLQKCGLASLTLCTIVYASHKFGCLDSCHLFTEHSIAHVVKLFKSLHTPPPTCQHVCTALAWWHINAMPVLVLIYCGNPIPVFPIYCHNPQSQWASSLVLSLPLLSCFQTFWLRWGSW